MKHNRGHGLAFCAFRVARWGEEVRESGRESGAQTYDVVDLVPLTLVQLSEIVS